MYRACISKNGPAWVSTIYRRVAGQKDTTIAVVTGVAREVVTFASLNEIDRLNTIGLSLVVSGSSEEFEMPNPNTDGMAYLPLCTAIIQ